MTIFEAVKDSVTTRQVAEEYGFDVKRNGMMCCPFHDDRNPSMKVDERFHCFGCGEDGDVIDFVGKMFDLSPIDTAVKLAQNFGISYDGYRENKPRISVLRRIHRESTKKKEDAFANDLCAYCRQLMIWKKEYAPKQNGEGLNPLVVEALVNGPYVYELIAEFMSGSVIEKASLMDDYAKKFKKKAAEIQKVKMAVYDVSL